MVDFGLGVWQLECAGLLCFALALSMLAAKLVAGESRKFRRVPFLSAALLLACLFKAFVVGGTKTNGVNGLPPRPLPPQFATQGSPAVAQLPGPPTPVCSANAARSLTAEDFGRGFVMARVGTGEAFDFSAPSNATVCADWQAC